MKCLLIIVPLEVIDEKLFLREKELLSSLITSDLNYTSMRKPFGKNISIELRDTEDRGSQWIITKPS